MIYQPAKGYMVVYHNPRSGYAPFFTFYPPQFCATRRLAEENARAALKALSHYKAYVFKVECTHTKITATYVSTPIESKE